MYWFIFSYLAATAVVLFLTRLIDFMLLFILAALIVLCLLWRWLRIKQEPQNVARSPDVLSSGLFCLAVFLLGAAWASLYAYIKVNQILPEALESREFYVEGKVVGLPKVEAHRQSFVFLLSRPLECPENKDKSEFGKALSGNEKSSLNAPWLLCSDLFTSSLSLSDRLFPLALSDWLLTESLLSAYINTMPSKMKLSWYGKELEPVRGGDRYRLLVKLKRPRAALNFNGFDYESWLFSEGYQAVGYIRPKGSNIILEDASLEALQSKKYFNLSDLRERLRQLLLVQFLSEPELNQGGTVSQESALILALIIGDYSYLSSQTRELLVQTGTAHLLSISGMHIGLLALFTFFVVLQLLKTFNRALSLLQNYYPVLIKFKSNYRANLYIATFISIWVALIYSLLAGFSLPTQRSLIMVCCYSVSLLMFEKPDFFKTWCIALFLILLFNPLAWLSTGLYLSFLALFVIQWALLTKPVLPNKKYREIRLMLRSQVAVFIGLSPVLLYAFAAFFPLAFVLNLFAVPWVSFLVLPLCFLGILMISINHTLAVIIFSWVKYLLMLFVSLLQYGVEFFSEYMQSSISVFSALYLFVFALLLLSPLAFRLKLFAIILLVPLAIDFFGEVDEKQKVPKGEFYLSVLDVGQGLAIIVETKNYLLLYDTGPAFGDNFDAGGAIVAPALIEKFTWNLSRGFKKNIDVMVLSHGDNDHIGGVQSVFKHFTIDKLWAYERVVGHDENDKQGKHEYPVTGQSNPEWQDCQKGQVWYQDDVKFEFLHPSVVENDFSPQQRAHYQRILKSSNNRSCVLKVTSSVSRLSLLIPGDIEKLAEEYLVENLGAEALQADILISPHHGSRSSSTLAFLQAVNPGLVLISAAYRSQFGHPHPDTLANYELLKIPFFNTADFGEIRVRSWLYHAQKSTDTLQFARKHKTHFWRLD